MRRRVEPPGVVLRKVKPGVRLPGSGVEQRKLSVRVAGARAVLRSPTTPTLNLQPPSPQVRHKRS